MTSLVDSSIELIKDYNNPDLKDFTNELIKHCIIERLKTLREVKELFTNKEYEDLTNGQIIDIIIESIEVLEEGMK